MTKNTDNSALSGGEAVPCTGLFADSIRRWKVTGNYRHIRRHIRFEEIQGFTVCRSNHGGAVLGRVEWFARWKEYEFIPEADTAYTVECLRDLAEFVGKMNAERKANNGLSLGAPAAERRRAPGTGSATRSVSDASED